MPGLLTPALCFGGGALIGIGIFVALNWEPICDRINEAMDEQRLYWEAIQEVRAQRQEAARRGSEKPAPDADTQVEKATGLYLAPSAGGDSEEDEAQPEAGLRQRFTEPQRRYSSPSLRGSSPHRPSSREASSSGEPSEHSSSEHSSSEHSTSERSSPELFAVYTVERAFSSDEEADEESDKSDSNEFSSYDKLDSSDLSSY